MIIEAVSSVSNKGLTPQITFGRKKYNDSSTPAVSTPIKAVPLAVLIALSPLNETKAVDIMHPEMTQATTELVQTQPKENIIYAQSFKTDNFPNVNVRAVNTRGNLDGFDKIEIQIDGEVFEVKDVSDIEAYLLSANGVKEGPLAFRQVLATYKKDSKTYPFLDQNLANYIAAVVTQGVNKSDIKNIEHKDYYIIPVLEYADLACIKKDSDYINSFLNGYKPNLTDFGTLIPSLTRNIQGTNGQYKVRFYSNDGNNNNYERITIQKEGESEFLLNAIETFKIDVLGIDGNINAGSTISLGLNRNTYEEPSNISISDEDLGKGMLNVLGEDKGQKNIRNIYIISKDTTVAFIDQQ